MRMYPISDNIDTLIDIHLAGVEGAVVHRREGLRGELDKALADKPTGIILPTEKFGREFPKIINSARLKRKFPSIVEILGRHGTGHKPGSITSYVNKAVRLKLQ